ncbi:MAG: alpha/beta fold hydrolase [Wenzhouxiangella sp.]|nr:alpha/beta fold hydrolase [Wenzhouxiangella sp.]MCH8477337.1 alpha/beta fold hydrolase [Wenzhouxiangella sp.]TVR93736.1 MAG: alpha/beta fold hydrolase [Wenzhouxiangellaceae bacterium]
MTEETSFMPRGLLGNAHVQSILTSGPWRRRLVQRKAADYLRRSLREVLVAADGARLLGFRNLSQVQARRHALVILLHGWEGSSESNYLLSAAVALDAAGFDTFRLNLRDHGPSHHLNIDLFHSCRLAEVLDVVGQLRQDYREGPVFLVGFSLGGNFTLRVARQAPGAGYGLDRAIAVSPVIRPRHVLDALEGGLSVYQTYFVRKWRRSLRIKQALYPDQFNLQDWFRLKTLRAQTEWLVEHYTSFPDLATYLEGYSVADDYLTGLETPTSIITAADDPIIPIDDFRALPVEPALDIEMLASGGHCGFIANWRMEAWIEQRLIRELVSFSS